MNLRSGGENDRIPAVLTLNAISRRQPRSSSKRLLSRTRLVRLLQMNTRVQIDDAVKKTRKEGVLFHGGGPKF
jgi:hypothetical protein